MPRIIGYLEVKELEVAPANEYNGLDYPGPGVYLMPDGDVNIVHRTDPSQYDINNMRAVPLNVIGLVLPNFRQLLLESPPETGGVDVHRLLDQIATITGRAPTT